MMNRNWLAVLTAVLALVFFLLYNQVLPVTDPVEANYALTAREMLESGDWLSPRIYGAYWFDKPVMTYWLLASSFAAFGLNEWAARLPGAVFAALGVGYACWLSLETGANKKRALLTALVLATSLEYWVLARLVLTDAVLFFFSAVTMGQAYLGLSRDQSHYWLTAYAASALAVLTKGPVGLVLPGLLLLAYVLACRDWRLLKRFRWGWGLVAFLLLVGPWYVWMLMQHGEQFVTTFLGLHNVTRATVSEHPDDNVFYYYLVLYPVSLLPWSGLLLASLLKRRAAVLQGGLSRYLWVWLSGTLLFYTLMATKYPTYVFPALFPGAMLAAGQLEQMLQGRCSLWWLTAPAALLWLLLGETLRNIPAAAPTEVVWPPVAVLLLVLALLQWKRRRQWLVAWVVAGIFAGACGFLSQGAALISERRSFVALADAIPQAPALVGAYGDYPTSAVFYSGRIAYRLEEGEAGQEPWQGKYTMPRLKTEEFLRIGEKEAIYLLVKQKHQEEMAKDGRFKEFQLLKSAPAGAVYMKKPEKAPR